MAGCAHVVVETEIELLESRMLNPRKIFTRCKLVTHLAGCRKVCLTISSDAETDRRCWWKSGAAGRRCLCCGKWRKRI